MGRGGGQSKDQISELSGGQVIDFLAEELTDYLTPLKIDSKYLIHKVTISSWQVNISKVRMRSSREEIRDITTISSTS